MSHSSSYDRHIQAAQLFFDGLIQEMRKADADGRAQQLRAVALGIVDIVFPDVESAKSVDNASVAVNADG